jgi:hypothetical protein
VKPSLVAIVALFILGCASHRPHEIDVTSFANYGDSPVQHTRYIGSDSEFHYFNWANFPRDGQWKVRKSTMPFRSEWPLDGHRWAFMSKDVDGTWQPKGAAQ